jgi:hypothetical protein
MGAEKAFELEGKVLTRDVRRGEPIDRAMFDPA